MSTISLSEATEKLARGVEEARPSDLGEIYSEIFPEEPVPASLTAESIARIVRRGLLPEEIVDLWSVVFPADRNVHHDVEADVIRLNEEWVEYVD